MIDIVIENPKSKAEDIQLGKIKNADDEQSLENVLKKKNIQSQKHAIAAKPAAVKKEANPIVDFDKTYDRLYLNCLLTRKSSPTPVKNDEEDEDLRIWKVYF